MTGNEKSKKKFKPKIPVGINPDMGSAAGPRCCGRNGAKTKYCRRQPGWGTDHYGSGRCFQHGGLSIITSGRYSVIIRESITDAMQRLREAERDPLDLLPELEMQRALLLDFIERYDKHKEALIDWHESYGSQSPTRKPVVVMDIADASRMINNISRLVEAINRLQPLNTVSVKTLKRIMEAMGETVAKHVQDQNIIEAIIMAWGDLRLEIPKTGSVEFVKKSPDREEEVSQLIQ